MYCWGPRSPGVPSPQATRRKEHVEPVPQTETCPRSKITGNPNGLSLAAHQTAVCAETQTDGHGHGKAPDAQARLENLRIPRKRQPLRKGGCSQRREGLCRLLSNSCIKKNKKQKNSSRDPGRGKQLLSEEAFPRAPLLPGTQSGPAPAAGQQGTRGADSSGEVLSGPGRRRPHGSCASRAAKIHSRQGPGSGQPQGEQPCVLLSPHEGTPPRKAGKASANQRACPRSAHGQHAVSTAGAPLGGSPENPHARQCLVQILAKCSFSSTHLKTKSSFAAVPRAVFPSTFEDALPSSAPPPDALSLPFSPDLALRRAGPAPWPPESGGDRSCDCLISHCMGNRENPQLL